jgi:hypothetical protein
MSDAIIRKPAGAAVQRAVDTGWTAARARLAGPPGGGRDGARAVLSYAELAARMEIGQATVLLTTAAQYLHKVAPRRSELLSLKQVLIRRDSAPEGCVALGPAMAAAPERFATAPSVPEDMALPHFTSGTPGKPKASCVRRRRWWPMRRPAAS